MAEERERRPCPHYSTGGPLVCWSCQYTLLVRSGVNQASLSQEQVAKWQRYVQTAQAQGREEMAAIVRQYNARGESNTFVGASNPGQLPSNYMYPTSIDDDIAVNSQTSTQVPQNGQIQSMSTQQDSSTQPSAPVVSRPGTSIHNGYRGMASNPSQPAPRQPPSTQRRMSQHVRAGRSRNNPQLSRRARTARTSVQNHADYDRGESTDEQD